MLSKKKCLKCSYEAMVNNNKTRCPKCSASFVSYLKAMAMVENFDAPEVAPVKKIQVTVPNKVVSEKHITVAHEDVAQAVITALPGVPVLRKTTKYGGIEIDIVNSQDVLVPKTAEKIDFPLNDRKALAIAIKHNIPALIIGETGTGKTSAVKEIAHIRKQPYIRVNMTGYTTPDELIGSKSVKDGKTYYEYGVITDAMRRGAVLVIDEVNATTPDCLFILHGLLDDDRRVTLPNGEVVTPHPDFRVFGTANPDYEGTKSMNRAFLNRWTIKLLIDTLSPAKEAELLTTRTGLKKDDALRLVRIASIARKDYHEDKILTYVSTRALLGVGKLVSSGMSVREAYETVIMKQSFEKDEQKALLDFFLATYKQAEGPEKDRSQPVIITKGEFDDMRKQVNEYRGNLNDIIRQRDMTIREMNVLKTLVNQYEEDRKKNK